MAGKGRMWKSCKGAQKSSEEEGVGRNRKGSLG